MNTINNTTNFTFINIDNYNQSTSLINENQIIKIIFSKTIEKLSEFITKAEFATSDVDKFDSLVFSLTIMSIFTAFQVAENHHGWHKKLIYSTSIAVGILSLYKGSLIGSGAGRMLIENSEIPYKYTHLAAAIGRTAAQGIVFFPFYRIVNILLGEPPAVMIEFQAIVEQHRRPMLDFLKTLLSTL